ncbi:hypothetical protein HRbin14_01963 [bacterium HR14]|nr:hypothetical protein HRbin14_01963 [bacterium HR14]
MQQRRQQLALHPFPQREAAYLSVQHMPNLQHLRQLVNPALKHIIGDLIERLEQNVRLIRGQIPPQLHLLPHHQRNLALHFRTALPRDKPQHPRRARCGKDDSGKHLQRSGLACPVRSQKAHQLAFFNTERNIAHRLHLVALAMKQALNRAPQSGRALVGNIGLAEAFRFDNGHGYQVYPAQRYT